MTASLISKGWPIVVRSFTAFVIFLQRWCVRNIYQDSRTIYNPDYRETSRRCRKACQDCTISACQASARQTSGCTVLHGKYKSWRTEWIFESNSADCRLAFYLRSVSVQHKCFLNLVVLLILGDATSQASTFLNDISKLAGIAYCSSLSAPFNCNKCADFTNTTLVQVFAPASSLTNRNLPLRTSQKPMAMLREMITLDESLLPSGAPSLLLIQLLTP